MESIKWIIFHQVIILITSKIDKLSNIKSQLIWEKNYD